MPETKVKRWFWNKMNSRLAAAIARGDQIREDLQKNGWRPYHPAAAGLNRSSYDAAPAALHHVEVETESCIHESWISMHFVGRGIERVTASDLGSTIRNYATMLASSLMIFGGRRREI
jgi:hypothetical protein